MTKDVQLLKEFIELALEAWNPNTRTFDTVTSSREGEEDTTKTDKKLKRNATSQDYEKSLGSVFEDDIEELRNSPEYKSLESFVQYKMDDEQEAYTTEELQALTRNIDFKNRKLYNALPPSQLVSDVKEELSSYGLKFIPRNAIKHFRGAMSNAHGTSPFAGTVGGGSGVNTTKGNPREIAGFGIGGGMGVMGGGYDWDASDKKNLPMGSRRR
jgi:hypothetical protein